MWVYLVKAELQLLDESGYSKNDVLGALKSLPKELEGMYGSILERLSKSKDKRDINYRKNIFFLVLSASRPFELDELQHALAITGHHGDAEFTPSKEFLTDRLVRGTEKRIIHCCGNLIEINKSRVYQP